MYNLHRFLIDYDMAMLRALAQNRGAALTSNRQAAAAEQLAATLLDPLSVRTALARLSPDAREALDDLLAAGGRMRVPQFARRFGTVRPVGSGRLEREVPWQQPANPAEELLYAAIIFRAFYQDSGGPGEFFFIPDDLRPLLPKPKSRAPAFAVSPVPEPPGQGIGKQTLLHDMFVYLVYLHNHDVRPYADGRLSRRDLSAIRGRMVNTDERRLAFLRHLAERLEFVVQKDKHLRLETSLVKRWLTAPTAQQMAMLQTAWRDDPSWNDLCHVPGLVCDQETAWQNDPLMTRQALLALLARCPLGTWWSIASFVAAVKETHPDFQRPDGDYTSWYIRDGASGKFLSGFEAWDRVEGALVTDLLTSPLRWLQIVTAVRTETDWICRLTETGARFLDLAPEEPEALPSSSIAVHADFCIGVPQPANLYTRFQLERFADLQSGDPCRYRLTVGGLGRALGRDVRVEQILAFLQQASDGTVPANVAGQLRIWAGRFGQVQVEEVALLTVKHERWLKELSILPETSPLIAQVLSPTVALVRTQDLPRLKQVLRAMGYLPPQDYPEERG